jgi:hypothetical protein
LSGGNERPIPTVFVGLAIATTILLLGATLFLPGGRLDWSLGCIYLGLIIGYVLVVWVCLYRWNPGLIEARVRCGAGTKTWDKVWAALYPRRLVIAVCVVAGLEARRTVSSLSLVMWLSGL